MEAAGLAPQLSLIKGRWTLRLAGSDDVPQPVHVDGDPYAYVISTNIHRRHLSAERRQELIIEIIALAPERSDRQIGKELDVDHKTISKARAKGEDVGRIPHVTTRTDSNRRRQPARRSPPKADPAVIAAADRAAVRAAAQAQKANSEQVSNIADRNQTPSACDLISKFVSNFEARVIAAMKPLDADDCRKLIATLRKKTDVVEMIVAALRNKLDAIDVAASCEPQTAGELVSIATAPSPEPRKDDLDIDLPEFLRRVAPEQSESSGPARAADEVRL
jgi:hypothetical protein